MIPQFLFSQAAGTAIGGAVSLLGGLVEPFKYKVARAAWHDEPVVIPDPHQILLLTSRAGYSEDSAKQWLKYWGIDWDTDKNAATGFSGLWRRYFNHCVMENPGIGSAFQCWAMGIFDDENRDAAVELAGGDPERWKPFLDSFLSWPGIPTALELTRRFDLPEQNLDYMLDRAMVPRFKPIRDKIKRSRLLLPTPSDLARFLVKDVWDEEIVKMLELDDDYDKASDLKEVAKRLGMEWLINDEIPLKNTKLSYWRMLCRAAYQEIAPTMAYRWRHKFRPNRVDHFKVENEAPKPFGLPELRKILKQADYPPGAHTWLAADSYATPRLVDARNALKFGEIQRGEFKEIMLDRGQTPDASEWITKLAEKQVKISRFPDARLGRQFQKRIISEQFYRNELNERGYTAAEIERSVLEYNPIKPPLASSYAAISSALDAGAIGNAEAVILLRDLTGSDQFAARAAKQMEIAIQTKTVRRTTAAVKRLFLQGRIDRGQAQNQLISLTVRSEAIARLMIEWDLLLLTKYKVLSATQTLRMLRKGILSRSEANARLSNLGYQPSERGPLLSEAEFDRESQLRAKRRSGNADGSESASRATLQKWFKLEIIDESVWIERMQSTGVTAEDIPRYREEALANG